MRKAALLLAFSLVASSSAADAGLYDQPQRPSEPYQRYKRTTEGANIAEWARRLDDPRPEIRLGAVRSLATVKDPEAISLLMRATTDSDARVAALGVDSLGRLQATEATDFLSERLFMKATPPPLHRNIVTALGQIGDTRASRPLLDFLERDLEPGTRGAAIFALGEIGDATIEMDLARLAERETDPDLRKLAGQALGKVRGRRVNAEPVPTGVMNPLLRPLD